MMKRHTKNASFPCRELSCERLALCRALCAKHYNQARHGWKLPLKYCSDTSPQVVSWLKVPAPVPAIVELGRAKWEFDGDEQSLIDADEKNILQSEEIKEHENDRQHQQATQ
jgi:hypothetical protein